MSGQKRPFSDLSSDVGEALTILEAGEYADMLPASKCCKETHSGSEFAEYSASRSLDHVASIYIPSSADEALQSIGEDDWENLVSPFSYVVSQFLATTFL